MITIIGVPLIAVLVIIQTSIISRLNISYGSADLVMVFLIAWILCENRRSGIWWAVAAGFFMSYISAVPFYSYLIGYVLIGLICMEVKKRMWNIPLIIMIVITFLGTVIYLMISFATISFFYSSLPLIESIEKIVLPSAAINMVISIPVFVIIRDIHRNEPSKM